MRHQLGRLPSPCGAGCWPRGGVGPRERAPVPGSKHSTSGDGVGWPEGEHPGMRPNTPTGSYRGEGSWAVPRGPESRGLCALRGGDPSCSGTTATVVGWVSNTCLSVKGTGIHRYMYAHERTHLCAHTETCAPRNTVHSQKYMCAHTSTHGNTGAHTGTHMHTRKRTCTHGNMCAHTGARKRAHTGARELS